jgi:hypothetical protein
MTDPLAGLFGRPLPPSTVLHRPSQTSAPSVARIVSVAVGKGIEWSA